MIRTPFFTTSWDGGNTLDLRIADLLAKYGLQGTFYLPVHSIKDALSPSEIRQLALRFEVGAHTVHHPVLTEVADAVARKEISDSKTYIEQITGIACSMFCFPYGAYHKKHLAMARSAGFRAVRTVELLSLDLPRQVSGILVLPTTLQAFNHSRVTYMKNVAKRLAFRNLRNYISNIKDRNWVSSAQLFMKSAIRGGGVFHLWGHSWEIDKYDLWNEVEDVFAMMRDTTAEACCLTNAKLCERANMAQ